MQIYMYVCVCVTAVQMLGHRGDTSGLYISKYRQRKVDKREEAVSATRKRERQRERQDKRHQENAKDVVPVLVGTQTFNDRNMLKISFSKSIAIWLLKKRPESTGSTKRKEEVEKQYGNMSVCSVVRVMCVFQQCYTCIVCVFV